MAISRTICALPAMFSMLLAGAASAGTVSSVYNFTSRDGRPTGQLALFGGLLYGTSEEGPNGTSTLFSVDPTTGAEHDVYTFDLQSDHSPNDGFLTTGGLTQLGNTLYGTTAEGSGTQVVNTPYKGFGTVFSFNPSTGVETPIHDFSGPDGAQPSLLYDPLVAYQGALYGTAYNNGPNGRGEIYKITPSGSFSVVYSFPTNNSGCNPDGVLIVKGTLYGTTAGCGQNGGGVVFSLNLAKGTEKILYNFAGGSGPLGQLLDDNGALLGVTQSAGVDHAGSVYKIDLASGAYTLLHTFTAAGNDGDQPSAGLTLFNGVVYGVTEFGPGQDILGTVFSIDPNTGAQATVGTFSGGPTGFAPVGPLLPIGNALYGTTIDLMDESSLQQGSVFKFTP